MIAALALCVTAMGLELFSPDEDRSAVVTAARRPEGIEASTLTRALPAEAADLRSPLP